MIPVTLAIDFGTKRIGLALSRASLAVPLAIVPNNEAVFATLLEVIREHSVEHIVVGLSEGAMAEQTRAFAAELQTHTAVPLSFADETLSSQVATHKLRAAKRSRAKGPIDHYAAAEFLQEWLDITY